MDGRLVGALVEAGLRVVDAVAGQHDLALDEHLRAVALDEEVAAEGHLARERLLERARVLVDHPDLERGGAAEDVLGARGVLHARELDDDAVAALLLDDRLGDAELVDAVAQDLDVLRDGAVLDALLRLGLERRDEPQLARRAARPRAAARSGNALPMSVRAASRSAASRKRTTTFGPSRAMPAYWIFFSRSSERMSVV